MADNSDFRDNEPNDVLSIAATGEAACPFTDPQGSLETVLCYVGPGIEGRP